MKKLHELILHCLDKKSDKVTLNPIAGRFLKSDKEPSIIPIQTKANTMVDMFNNGFASPRNISKTIAYSVKININM